MYLLLTLTMDNMAPASPSESTETATASLEGDVQLPHGMTLEETCAALQIRLNHAGHHQKSVLYYWNKFDCASKLVSFTHLIDFSFHYSLTHSFILVITTE